MSTRAILLVIATWGIVACSSQTTLPPTKANSPPTTRENARSYFDLGQSYGLRGDSNRAEEYLRLAIELGYPLEQALPALLRVCLEAGRLRVALDYAEPRLKTHPADIGLRQLVATIHLALGNPAKASDELEEVLRQAPTFASAHYLLATVYETAFGDSKTAAFHYRAYARLEPRGTHAAEALNWLRERDLGQPSVDEEGESP